MAKSTKLNLLVQKSAPQYSPAKTNPYAKVLVDVGAQVENEIYTYLVPEKFQEDIQAGVLVEVEFHGRKKSGYVLERLENGASGFELKYIQKVLSVLPIYIGALRAHIEQVAKFYACNLWSIINVAIPKPMRSIEKAFFKSNLNSVDSLPHITKVLDANSVSYENNLNVAQVPSPQTSNLKHEMIFKYFQPHELMSMQLAHFCTDLFDGKNQVLVILPDAKSIDDLSIELSNLIESSAGGESVPDSDPGSDPGSESGTVFDAGPTLFSDENNKVFYLNSSIGNKESYANYLRAWSGTPGIYIGNRSAIFTPLSDGAQIAIVNDNEFAHWETRHPGWNTRKISMLRADGAALNFIAAAPSLEIQHMLDQKIVKFMRERSKHNINLICLPTDESDLTELRKASSGNQALVVSNREGFINTLYCSNCREIAKCHCGGNLQISQNLGDAECSLGNHSNADWRCAICNNKKYSHGSKGAHRQAFELSKALPEVAIHIYSDKYEVEKLNTDKELTIDVADISNIPNRKYDVISVQANLFHVNANHLRGEEILFRRVAQLITYLNEHGTLILRIENTSTIAQTLLRGNFSKYYQDLMRERAELSLIPYYMFTTISGDDKQIEQMYSAATKNPLFKNASKKSVDGESYLILRSMLEKEEELSAHFNELSRLNIKLKQKPIKYRIDPFEIKLA